MELVCCSCFGSKLVCCLLSSCNRGIVVVGLLDFGVVLLVMFGLVGILSVVGWFVDCVVVVALVGVLHTNISRSLTNNQTHYYYTKSNKPTSSCLLFHFFQFFCPTTTLNNYVELLVGGELNRVCGVCWSVGK